MSPVLPDAGLSFDVLNVGGNWNNGSNCGFFYFNANNTSSNTNSNIGSRLTVRNRHAAKSYTSHDGISLTPW